MSSILDIARGEVGTTEFPPGSNRVRYWAYLKPEWQGQPWCAAFVAWCWQRAGIDLVRELGSGVFYVPTVEAWARKIGAWRTDCAEPGDLVIYGIGDGHIGIAWPDPATPTYRAIEGNTSAGNSGSQDNGGGVFIRQRARSLIRGWVRMSVVAERLGVTPAPEPVQAPARPMLVVDGIRGPATHRRLQEWLGVAQDGIVGRNTIQALQRRVGVTQDGILGPQTVAGLQRLVGARVDGVWGPQTTRALQAYLNGLP